MTKIFVFGTRGFPGIQGGVEKHCEELYPRLVQMGCDITVITRTPYIKEKRDEWRGVKFVHLWAPKHKNLEAVLHSFFAAMIAVIKGADIVHVHAIGPAMFIPLIKLFGIPVVMTHHGPDYLRKKWGILGKLVLKTSEKAGIQCADKIISISNSISERIKLRFNKDCVLIPNGVHKVELDGNTNILNRYDLESKNYIFTACRFVPEKGLDDLIAAYLKIENPNYKLVIAGDSDHPDEYSKKIKSSVLGKKGIVLTGIVTGNDLMNLFGNAGLFVLPSYYEGLPIALLEALSLELPVLVSDIPQNKEITIPDCRYFKVHDVNELSRKMTELFPKGIDNDERILYREIISKKYNWDIIARKTFDVYGSLLR